MSVGKQPDWRTKPHPDQSPTIIGNSKNFWKWSKEEGFDLTHPPTPESEPVQGRMRLQCALTPVVIDPAKTALLVIDLQNYDLSKALGNHNQAVFDAEDTVLNYAIPAARKSGIQIIYVTTGYSDQDLLEMDPAVFRTFNFEPVVDSPNWAELPPGEGYSNKGQYRNKKGIGDPIGEIELEDGTKIDAGRILVRGTWNSWLHDPLAAAYEESQSMELPDIHFYKNRSSGMCERMTALTDYLNEKNLRTLLFTGINIDQCVMGTLQDAYLKGFDTILLKDGCATDSQKYAQMSCEFNCAISWGFLSSCKDFADAVSKL
ncbi:isochorismatase family protein [Pochonia chlamydosporia 170]|uniref:Isochorismatase family protein n=1 Tax=Pochonia chlamydosporia 170 TaxID=1380566 RepID=A0A179FP08_METCM|nr:isochorismatase family protein [Pochonia chlamydosporia 170]OAQ67332.1 isochorismatase family protein [Pochonia chlamydosporia 170]